MAASRKKILELRLDILPKETSRALRELSSQALLSRAGWYLAGGTALALQVAHRQSVDLDFFLAKKAFSEQSLISALPASAWKTEILREGTIYGRWRDAKVSFIAYPFFVPRRPMHRYGTVRILDAPDIAVMKMIAISQRGKKRDFIDLYWYCTQREPLWEIALRLSTQYPSVAHNYHHIIKSLMYFDDAENDPMPRLFFAASWKNIKAYFRREVPRLARNILRLS